MKKISTLVILLLLIGTLWGGASWFIGEETEKLVKQQVELSQQQLVKQGPDMTYELASYDKQFMGAKAVTKLQLGAWAPAMGFPEELQFIHDIKHGPVLWGDRGVKLGASRWVTTLDQEAIKDAEARDLLKQLFNEKQPFVAHIDANFDKTIDYEAIVNPISFEEGDQSFKLDGATIKGQSQQETLSGVVNIVVNTLTINSPDVNVAVPNITVNGDMTTMLGSSVLGKVDLKADNVSVLPAGQTDAITFDVAMDSDTKQVDDTYQGISNININNVKGMEDMVQSVAWNIDFSGFKIAGLEKLQTLQGDIQSLQSQLMWNTEDTETPEGVKKMNELMIQLQEKNEAMFDVIFAEVLEADKSRFKQDVKVTNAKGNVDVNMDVLYAGSGEETLTLNRLMQMAADPQALAALIKGDVSVVADKAIFPPMLAAMFLSQPLEQKLVIDANEQYSFNLKLLGESLELNGEAMTVMDLVAKFMPGMPQAPANEGLEQDGALGLDLPEDIMLAIETEGFTPEVMQLIEESDDITPETMEMLKQLQQLQAMEAASQPAQ